MKRTYNTDYGEIERNLNGTFIKGHEGYNKDSGFGLSYFKRDKRWFIICKDKKKIPFSRAVVECYLGKTLSKCDVIHHINEIKTDDRIENLMIVTRAQHINIHRKDLKK